MPRRNLNALLNPKSIAVIGASNDPSRIGGRILGYLKNHGYQGDIFQINPKHQEIEGIRCCPDVASLSREIDVALVAVPENLVLSVLEEAGKAKVKAAIIYSSGFSEMGEEGKGKQLKLRQLAEQYGISVCGPNCVGIIGFHNRTAMSFSQFLDVPKLIPGDIAFVSQSGALGGSLLNRIQDSSIGISHFVSTGNEAVLETSDYIEYFLDDPRTSVIMVLMEGIRNGEKFLRAADLALKRGKPIVVMKVGKTGTGGKAASSHTGSMTGSDRVYDAIFRQKGVIRVDELEDLYLTASTLSKCKLTNGPRVGIITTTGGGGVILSDELVSVGMEVPELSAPTMEKLSGAKAAFGIVKNPLDLTAQVVNDPLLFPKSIQTFVQDENLDNIIVALSMVAGERSKQRASYIIDVAQTTDKPILTWWASGSLSAPGMKMLEGSQVPIFSSPTRCVKALHALYRHAKLLKKKDDGVTGAAPAVVNEGGFSIDRIQRLHQGASRVLAEHEGKEILAAYGIPVTKEALGSDCDETRRMASEIGYPVALKVVSPEILHKTEVGGLRLHLNDEHELRKAYDQIIRSVKHHKPDANIEGMLVQEMAAPGTEVIIGVIQDPQFGPMVMFGPGGIFVEVLKDFSLRHPPLSEIDAWEMIREIKGFQLLDGARGERKRDQQAIVSALMAVSRMALDLKDVFSEIDINPLVVYPEGAGLKAIDCLFVKKDDAGRGTAND